MRQQFQVLPGLNEPTAAATAAPAAPPLPFLATANDVRGVIHYLRKRPDGVTLGEAVDAVKKQSFEPGKLVTYELLGITVRNGDRFKLSQFGWEMARRLEPEAQAFRALLGNVEPYRSVLEWARRQKLDVITHPEVAAHWREHFPDSLGVSTPKMVEGHVVCFFQLCQAAALGTHVIGKKGQPTRLRLDRDESLPHGKTSSAFEAPDAHVPNFHETATAERRGAATPILARSANKTRAFISHGGEAEFADRIRVTLDLADIESHVVERTDTDSPLVPTDTARAMRQCEAAVIIVSGDDCSTNGAGEQQLDPSLLVIIGAAAVLYDGRVLLVWEKPMPASVHLRDVSHCTREGCEMTWETGVEIIKAVKGFKNTAG